MNFLLLFARHVLSDVIIIAIVSFLKVEIFIFANYDFLQKKFAGIYFRELRILADFVGIYFREFFAFAKINSREN